MAINPKSLATCALLDKKMKRIVTIDLDYVGFEVDDLFVIGYELDYNQKYRNLPHIGAKIKKLSKQLKVFFHLVVSNIEKYAIINMCLACVAELVDALDSKSSDSDIMWVRVPPQAPNLIYNSPLI